MHVSERACRRSGSIARHNARCRGAAMMATRLTADVIALARQYGRSEFRPSQDRWLAGAKRAGSVNDKPG